MENGNKYIVPSITLFFSGVAIFFILNNLGYSENGQSVWSGILENVDTLAIPIAIFVLSVISFLLENRKVYRPLNILIISALILAPIVTLTLAVLSLGAPW